MSKAEDLSREYVLPFLNKACEKYGEHKQMELSRFDGYDMMSAYEEGYHQAEKDLELTWKDLATIEKLGNDFIKQNHIPMSDEEFYQEVLKRYKERKGKKGTMRPEELSIGNYVYGIEIEGGDETAESLVTRYPIQIECIYGDTIIDNYGMERDIKDGIEPIPLTAEILEKNFTKKGNRYGIYEDFYDFELHEYNDGMWQAVYHNCEISSIPDEQSSVCFVHQLQRMMTDCYCAKTLRLIQRRTDV